MTHRTAEDMIADLTHYGSLVRKYSEKVIAVTAELSAVARPDGPPEARPSGHRVKSLRTWATWLRANGPALRAQVAEGTGTNLTHHALPHILEWKGHMEFWDAATIPDDTVLTIPALSEGRGRPPKVYFIWADRYKVYPKFGVGPYQALTGVVQPEPTEDRVFNFTSEEFADASWPTEFPKEGDPTIWDDLPEVPG